MSIPTVRTEEVSFGSEGPVGVPPNQAKDAADLLQTAALNEIVTLVQDPNIDLAAVYKKIALQIAYLTLELSTSRRDPTAQYQVKSITEQIKALRELSHTLEESDEVSHRDVLNFDGEKFRYVLRHIVDTFKDSLKESGIEGSMSDNILRIYRDKMFVKEGELRKDLARFTNLPPK